jgi:hypothetical protein
MFINGLYLRFRSWWYDNGSDIKLRIDTILHPVYHYRLKKQAEEEIAMLYDDADFYDPDGIYEDGTLKGQ